MKKMTFVGLLAFLVVSGAALAEQAGEQNKGSSMKGLMQEMMGDQGKGRRMGDMGGMQEMMGQMDKMMDQCSAMMESMHGGSSQPDESQKR